MTYHRVTLAVICTSVFVVCWQGSNQAAAQVNVDVGGVHVQVGDNHARPPETVEVLTRGPLHEAFAQPVIFDGGVAYIITHRPPTPLEEIVPYEKPDGNHIVWIPGYWSWDSDRGDFIWVSGCWRAVPPGTSWVPGYWAKNSRGYQWVAGFWTAADTEEIEYLPAPPATLEEGPRQTSSPDNIWIPGCWVRFQGHYAWRPGFWEQARPNWVWVPSQYVFTPRGYVYVDGYWDYSLERRGVAFLPIYCPPSLYERADYRYSPDIVLDLDGLTLNLFISPQRRHYYFGDYYGSEYSREDYRPWYEVRDHHDWYDPIFVHQQWQHRDDNQWFTHQREGYDHRRDDQAARPARNYEDMKAQQARLPEKDRKQVQLARPINEVVADKSSPTKFNKLDDKTRESTASRAKDVHDYTNKRSQWESTPAGRGDGAAPKEADRTAPKESSKQPTNEATPSEKTQAPDRGAAVKEQPTKEQPAREQPVKEQPAKEQPTKEQPAKEQPAKEQPTRGDTQSEKVKVPKPPVVVHEPVQDPQQTPPPRPQQPKSDPDAQPKAPRADAPDRSRDSGNSDKDKPDSKKP